MESESYWLGGWIRDAYADENNPLFVVWMVPWKDVLSCCWANQQTADQALVATLLDALGRHAELGRELPCALHVQSKRQLKTLSVLPAIPPIAVEPEAATFRLMAEDELCSGASHAIGDALPEAAFGAGLPH